MRFLALISALFIAFQVSASEHQVNDSCASAIALTVGQSCNYTTFTIDTPTISNDGSPLCGDPNPKDQWFSFQMPASGNLVIDVLYINSRVDISVYTGSCGSLVNYKCDRESGTVFSMPYIFIQDSSLAGQTLYLQIWEENNKPSGSFDLCLFEPEVPSNANIDSSVSLSVQSSCGYLNFTTKYAGQSSYPAPSCGPIGTESVWFDVVVPASGNLIINTVNLGIGDAGMTIYSGDKNNLLEVTCRNTGSENFNMPLLNLQDTSLAGEKLFVRIYRESGALKHGGAFGICAFEPVLSTNNSCANALFKAPDTNCNYERYNSTYLKNSGRATPPCGNFSAGDIWFKTIVPESGKLVFTTRNPSSGATRMAIYNGTCDSLVLIECNSNSSPNFNMPEVIINDTSLIGDTLYAMLWRENSSLGQSVDLCIFEPEIASNINCANAELLTTQSSCNYLTFSNEYAKTSGDGAPNCGDYDGSDVWFKFEVPSTGEFTISSRQVDFSNGSLALYSGECGNLSLIACDENTGPGNFPEVVLSNPSLANQTLYIQFWRTSSINGSRFDLCVFGNLVPVIKNPKNQILCDGDSLESLSVTDEGFQYNWYDQNINGNLLAGDTFEFLPDTPGVYYVEAVNSTTLEKSAREPIQYKRNPNPLIVGAIDVALCANDSIIPLEIQDYSKTYNWFGDSLLTTFLALDTNKYQPISNGTYYVQAIDSSTNCISNPVKINYTISPNPLLSNPKGFTGCDFEVIPPLTVQDLGKTYSWYSDSLLQNLVAFNKASFLTETNGIYYVQAYDSVNSCFSTAIKSVELLIHQTIAPTINFDGANLFSTPVSNYKWYKDNVLQINETDSIFAITSDGTYYLETTDTNGCVLKSNSLIITGTSVVNNSALNFEVYPNPFSTIIKVELDNWDNYRVRVSSITGKLISEKVFAGSTFSLNTSKMLGGTYILSISNSTGEVSNKLLVKY